MRAVLTIRREPAYRREAFEQGLKRVGFTIGELSAPADSSDWLVLWGKKRGADEQRADAWEKSGGTVIVAENGYLAKTEKTHYAISVHGHNGSGWFPIGDEDRFSPLGFELKPWRKDFKKFGEIVVRAQRGIGSTLMASPPGWAENKARELRRGFTIPVRVVQHPGDKNKHALDAASIARADMLYVWSSALGVRALVEGIPVEHSAPHWICENWTQSREAAIHRMSHGQWRFDEIATGEPFARIIEHRGEAAW